jgi:hypothetical protein
LPRKGGCLPMSFDAGLIARDASEMKRRLDAPTPSGRSADVVQRARDNPNAPCQAKVCDTYVSELLALRPTKQRLRRGDRGVAKLRR